jgi:hypothetical protein
MWKGSPWKRGRDTDQREEEKREKEEEAWGWVSSVHPLF